MVFDMFGLHIDIMGATCVYLGKSFLLLPEASKLSEILRLARAQQAAAEALRCAPIPSTPLSRG